jgi:hypothetical protein
MDWETGKVVTRLILPSSHTFNGAFSLLQILPNGVYDSGGIAWAVSDHNALNQKLNSIRNAKEVKYLTLQTKENSDESSCCQRCK